MPGPNDIESALLDLTRLYAEVDALAGQLHEHHKKQLLCRRGCYSCCADGLTVFEVEAEFIKRNCADILLAGQPHAAGHCAFLDQAGACRIYPHRPYVCRTQGLPLRWFEESSTGGLVEHRDICPLNDGGTPLEEMDQSEFWLIGPFEARLAGLQRTLGATELRRVPLRVLFEVKGP